MFRQLTQDPQQMMKERRRLIILQLRCKKILSVKTVTICKRLQ